MQSNSNTAINANAAAAHPNAAGAAAHPTTATATHPTAAAVSTSSRCMFVSEPLLLFHFFLV